MNTPNIDLLLSDITFRRGWLAKMLEVTVHDGDDTRFDAVSIVDLIHEIRALRQQRDEARDAFDTVISLAPIYCERLHHTKKDYHESGEPCPVEARIKTLIQITQGDA